jgi:hypothetical protein
MDATGWIDETQAALADSAENGSKSALFWRTTTLPIALPRRMTAV